MKLQPKKIVKITSSRKLQTGGVVLAIAGTVLLATSISSSARLSALANVKAGAAPCQNIRDGNSGCSEGGTYPGNNWINETCSYDQDNEKLYDCDGKKSKTNVPGTTTYGDLEDNVQDCLALAAIQCQNVGSILKPEYRWKSLSGRALHLCGSRTVVLGHSPTYNDPDCTPTPTPTPGSQEK